MVAPYFCQIKVDSGHLFLHQDRNLILILINLNTCSLSVSGNGRASVKSALKKSTYSLVISESKELQSKIVIFLVISSLSNVDHPSAISVPDLWYAFTKTFKLVISIRIRVIRIKSFTLNGQTQLFLARESPLSHVVDIECEQTLENILVEFIPNIDFLKPSEDNDSYHSRTPDNMTLALKGSCQQPFFHLLPLSILFNNYKTPSALANQLVVMTPVQNGPLWCQGGRGCRKLM